MKKQISKNIPFLFLLLVFGILQEATVSADTKYTRERSEKLHHLIHWSEYAPRTFQKAQEEKKPIFLVISAPAWCYWCHVYESEDYLFHPLVYEYINEHFIPIFVDSDKRPDLTKKYLEGGWPSTTIFTPNMIRIVGFSGPAKPTVLREYLERLVVWLRDESLPENAVAPNYDDRTFGLPRADELTQIENEFLAYVVSRYDPKFGGFTLRDLPKERTGQKFPKPLTYKFLLERYHRDKDQRLLEMVKFTFENQYTEWDEIKTRYHLYDPIEGGFHRYSTRSDWSNPHYEKMLHDQARFILAYSDLFLLTNDERVGIALDGTKSFVLSKFYDPAGAFYSSQDAHLEGHYFGATQQERARLDQPYIDKTLRSDANAMMISSLLHVYDVTGEQNYREISDKSLSFLQRHMIGKDGVYYYYDYEKKRPFLTGQSISNSWVLLAFVEGYEKLGDEKYLTTAEAIAGYALSYLYDWNVGGFFERNSRDADFYAPNERLDLAKPYAENAVFSYSLLRLYQITGDLNYLVAGMKSMARLISNFRPQDETYYLIKAARLAAEHSLIEVYNQNIEKINDLINAKQNDFFLYELLDGKNIDEITDDVPKLKDEFFNVGLWILALLAFSTGLLSFLSPCTLPILPAYFAHTVGAGKGEILKNTLSFFVGLGLVFSVFGMGATMLGSLLREHRVLLTRGAGALIILFGLLQILGKGFSGFQISIKENRRTVLGSFLFGGVFALGWSACIGPILSSLLLMSATTETLFRGSILLFIYALGLAAPLVFLSLCFDRIKNRRFWRFLKGRMLSISILGRTIQFHTTSLVSGSLLILIGFLIFNDYLFALNQYSLQTGYVQELLIGGEESLKELLLR
jgi:uncharacterized protein YyaL (SSP411 family)